MATATFYGNGPLFLCPSQRMNHVIHSAWSCICLNRPSLLSVVRVMMYGFLHRSTTARTAGLMCWGRSPAQPCLASLSSAPPTTSGWSSSPTTMPRARASSWSTPVSRDSKPPHRHTPAPVPEKQLLPKLHKSHEKGRSGAN